MVLNTKHKVVSAENVYDVGKEMAEAMGPHRPKPMVPAGAQAIPIKQRGSILSSIPTPHGIPVKTR